MDVQRETMTHWSRTFRPAECALFPVGTLTAVYSEYTFVPHTTEA
jgi:hypothetical protein